MFAAMAQFELEIILERQQEEIGKDEGRRESAK
jgi:hypothetical protein